MEIAWIQGNFFVRQQGFLISLEDGIPNWVHSLEALKRVLLLGIKREFMWDANEFKNQDEEPSKS